MKPIPWYILPIVAALFIGMCVVGVRQCTKIQKTTVAISKADSARQKAVSDYIALVKAKQHVDTLWRKLPGKTIHDSIDKPVIDTFYMEGKQVYAQYKDSLIGVGLRLHTAAVAIGLKSLDYTYELDQQVVTKENIVYVHDTTRVPVKQVGHVYALGDVGLNTLVVGAQWQSRKRFGATVKYNIWTGAVLGGVTYKIW